MSGKKPKMVWKHPERDAPVEPLDVDVFAEVQSGSRNRMFTCPVCTRPLMYRMLSAVKMDTVCPNCRIAVLILKPLPTASSPMKPRHG